MKKENGENIALNDYLREFCLVKKNKNTIVVNNIDNSNSIKFKKDELKEKNKIHTKLGKNNVRTSNTAKNTDTDTIKESKKKIKIDSTYLINLFKIIAIIALCVIIANTAFIFLNNKKYSNIDEEFKTSITNSLKSPNTTVEINSTYDLNVHDSIFYFKVSDKLDAYTYLLKDSDIDAEFRKILLEKTLLNNTKNIKLQDLNLNEVDSILLHNDKYIINNKFNLNTSDVSKKDLQSIQDSILNNNRKDYQNKKNMFYISGVAVGVLLSTLNIKKRKPTKNKSVSNY